MAYPPSKSRTDSKISTGLSTQMTIKVGGVTVGAIQQIAITQNREMQIWQEIGTDGIVEIHPKGAAKVELQINRAVFDDLRLPEAFARGFINIQAQRIPFDIEIMDGSNADSGKNYIVHTYNNCWFRAYSPTYRADNFLVVENATVVAQYVTTTRDSVSAVLGGIRGIAYETDSVERSTDVNGRVGRLEPTSFGSAIGGNLAG